MVFISVALLFTLFYIISLFLKFVLKKLIEPIQAPSREFRWSSPCIMCPTVTCAKNTTLRNGNTDQHDENDPRPQRHRSNAKRFPRTVQQTRSLTGAHKEPSDEVHSSDGFFSGTAERISTSALLVVSIVFRTFSERKMQQPPKGCRVLFTTTKSTPETMERLYALERDKEVKAFPLSV